MEDLIMEKKEKNSVNLLTRENIFLFISALLLGILFDTLFYGKVFGISYPIFIIAYYIVFFYNLRKNIKIRLDFGFFLTLPVVMLSFTYFLFSNDFFRILNFMAVPILLVAQSVIVSKNNQYDWFKVGFIIDLLYGMIVRVFEHTPKPFKMLFSITKDKSAPGKYDNIKKVLIGLLISIPLLVVVISLLSSADQVFGLYMGKIPQFFDNIQIGEFILRVGLIGGVALVSFSYIWSLIYKVNYQAQHVGTINYKVMDPVVIITILTAINLIYIFFVFIQFSYLFGSLNSTLPSNLSYAEYARRGFFELVAVTVINFSLLLGCMYLVKIGSKLVHRVLQILYTLLITCTSILLFSAHFRMNLYEETYGYTYLRIMTHSFMVFLLVLFIIALYKVWKMNVSLVKPYIVIALIAYVGINYMNIDAMIAKLNIDRFHKDRSIDVYYLEGLSNDAIPQLTRLLDNNNKKYDNVAHIQNYLYTKKADLAKKQPWQSFNWSNYKAKKVLAKYKLQYDMNLEHAVQQSRNSELYRD